MSDLFPTWRTYRTFGIVHFVDAAGIEYTRLSQSLDERDKHYVADCIEFGSIDSDQEILDFRIPLSMTRAGYCGWGPEDDAVLTLRLNEDRTSVVYSCEVVSVGVHTRSNEVRSGTKSIGRCVVRNWSVLTGGKK